MLGIFSSWFVLTKLCLYVFDGKTFRISAQAVFKVCFLVQGVKFAFLCFTEKFSCIKNSPFSPWIKIISYQPYYNLWNVFMKFCFDGRLFWPGDKKFLADDDDVECRRNNQFSSFSLFTFLWFLHNFIQSSFCLLNGTINLRVLFLQVFYTSLNSNTCWTKYPLSRDKSSGLG